MSWTDKLLENIEPVVMERFEKWAAFLHEHVAFSMPHSSLHSIAHTERVLLYALILCEQIFPNDIESQEVLANAAIFHDTRRRDDGLDAGHGARGAAYYEKFCQNHGLHFYQEAASIMQFHDLDDVQGYVWITNLFGNQANHVKELYRIFKDADALDRWRLGPKGLDIKYLRHNESRKLVNFSRALIAS